MVFVVRGISEVRPSVYLYQSRLLTYNITMGVYTRISVYTVSLRNENSSQRVFFLLTVKTR